MKRLYLTILFWILGLIIIPIPHLLLTRGLNFYLKDNTVEKVLKREIEPDIAIFGSSVAWVHFNPKVIEELTLKTCYNFGLDGSNLDQYGGLLEEFIENSNTKFIVIAGTVGEFTKRQSIYDFYRYHSWLDNANIYSYLFNIDSDLVWKARYIPLYKQVTFNTRMYKNAVRGYFGKTYLKDNNEFKGYSRKQLNWRENPSSTPIQMEFDNTVLAKYKKIIDSANKKDITIILVLTPIHKDFQERIVNLNRTREIYQILAGDKNYFFDFTNSDICNKKSLFYNSAHLNASGATIFSKEFSNMLVHQLNKKFL